MVEAFLVGQVHDLVPLTFRAEINLVATLRTMRRPLGATAVAASLFYSIESTIPPASRPKQTPSCCGHPRSIPRASWCNLVNRTSRSSIPQSRPLVARVQRRTPPCHHPRWMIASCMWTPLANDVLHRPVPLVFRAELPLLAASHAEAWTLGAPLTCKTLVRHVSHSSFSCDPHLNRKA